MSYIQTTIEKAIAPTPNAHTLYKFCCFSITMYTTSLECAADMLANSISITVLVKHHIRGWEEK